MYKNYSSVKSMGYIHPPLTQCIVQIFISFTKNVILLLMKF